VSYRLSVSGVNPARCLSSETLPKEGFVEYKIEIDEEDLEEITENDLRRHAELDFDEIEIVNNRPRNSGLYAQYRKHLDSEIREEA
jgi:hypothetical protein